MLPLRLPRQTPPTLSSIREEDGVQVVRGHRWWASGVRPGVRVHSHSGGPVLVSMSLSALGNSSRGGSFSSWYQSFRLGFRQRLQTLGEPEVLHGSPDDRARGSCRNLTRSPTLFSLPWASPLERQKAASSVAPSVARSGVSARRGSDYPAVCSSCIPAGPPHELHRDLTLLSPHTSPGRTYYYPHFTEEGTRPEK